MTKSTVQLWPKNFALKVWKCWILKILWFLLNALGSKELCKGSNHVEHFESCVWWHLLVFRIWWLFQKNVEKCDNTIWKDGFSMFGLMLWTWTLTNNNSNNNVIITLIWHNSDIKVVKESMFYKEWYKKGVKTVKYFLHNDRLFLLKSEFEKKI